MSVIDRYFDALTGRSPGDGLWTPDCRVKTNGTVAAGPDAAAQHMAAFQDSTDAHVERLGRLERDDGIAITWRFTGTHAGQVVTVEGASRFTLRDGRIHRMAARWDEARSTR